MCIRPFLVKNGNGVRGRGNKTGGRKIVNRVEGSSGLNSGLSSGNREKWTDRKHLTWKSRIVPYHSPSLDSGMLSHSNY